MFDNIEKAENKEKTENKEEDPEVDMVEGNWKLVDLPEVEVKTGEEVFEELYVVRAKTYRYVDNQWKERGIGDFKFLKHKETGLVYGVQRQDQIFKIRLSFFIYGDKICQLEKFKTQERCWQFICYDNSENEPKLFRYCIRFNKDEESEKFKEVFEESYKTNTEVKNKGKTEDAKEEEKKE